MIKRSKQRESVNCIVCPAQRQHEDRAGRNGGRQRIAGYRIGERLTVRSPAKRIKPCGLQREGYRHISSRINKSGNAARCFRCISKGITITVRQSIFLHRTSHLCCIVLRNIVAWLKQWPGISLRGLQKNHWIHIGSRERFNRHGKTGISSSTTFKELVKT